MARRPVHSPNELGRRAFSVAEARAQGMTRRMLDHSRFTRPFHGVRQLEIPSDANALVPEAQILSVASRFTPRLRPSEAFSHTTALFLHGVPIRAPLDIHVTIPRPASQARTRKIIGHRATEPFEIFHVHPGLPCVSPLTALVQAAPLLSNRDLVVALDHLSLPATRSRPHEELERVRAHMGAASGRGVPRLRQALELSRVGAESRMETLVRLELAALGLDTLELQLDVYDADSRWIGRFDLVDLERRLIIEYDGEQHRTDRNQYLRDQRRLDRAWAAGYRVLRLTAEDLLPSRRHQTRSALCRFLGTAPRPVPERILRFLR